MLRPRDADDPGGHHTDIPGRTSPLAPAYLTSASGRKEASRLAPTLAARVPLHLLHLYLPISAHGDTTHPAVTPWRALGPCPSRPTADPRTTVLALVLKTTGLPWWLGVNNPPSSAGGTGPTPLGNTRSPGASSPRAQAPSQEGLCHGSCRKGSAARRPGTAKINTYNYFKKVQNNLTCASDPHHSQPSHSPQENFQVTSLILHMGPRGSGTSEPL